MEKCVEEMKNATVGFRSERAGEADVAKVSQLVNCVGNNQLLLADFLHVLS